VLLIEFMDPDAELTGPLYELGHLRTPVENVEKDGEQDERITTSDR
jgi:hypothetical protein